MARAGAAGAYIGLGLPLSACSVSESQPVRLAVLTAAQAQAVWALAEAVRPPQPGFPDATATQVVSRFDEELWQVDASIRDDLTAALTVFEWLPWAYGFFSRFSALPVDARRSFVEQRMASRSTTVRAIATNLRLLATFFYFGHPASWAAIGYDGPFQKLAPIPTEAQRAYAVATGARR